jgi:hypothetical protein
VIPYGCLPVRAVDKARRSGYNGTDSEETPLRRAEAAMPSQRHSVLLVALLLASGSPHAAGQDAPARTLLEDAIKAHGGETALAKTRLTTRKISGNLVTAGKPFQFTAEITQDLPERSRASFELATANQKINLLLVRAGDKGWRSTGGVVAEMAKEEVAELQEEAQFWWLLGLLPLRQAEFELTSLPAAMVHGRPAAGIKVARKGYEEVKLYFDKASHLLVKAERKAKEAGMAVDKELLFSEHKPFDGAVLPTKLTELTNGKKFLEATSIAYQFLGKVEEGTFARP